MRARGHVVRSRLFARCLILETVDRIDRYNPRFSCSSRNNTFPWTQPCFSWTDLESTREFPPSSCVAHGDSESTLGARSRCLNRGRPSRCVRIRARTTVPINLVMGEKLPRLRLKTHPATAIFSQHLRITRNCRSFPLSAGDPFLGTRGQFIV